MVNRLTKRNLLLLLIVVGVIVIYYFKKEPSAIFVERSSPWPNVGRYENREFGFSIEYDADLLTQTAPMTEPGYVFARNNQGKVPSLAVQTVPDPEGKELKKQLPLMMKAIENALPGSAVKGSNNEAEIVLADGTDAFYFEINYKVGIAELISAFVMASENDRLIRVIATDRINGSMENLKTMVQTLAFDVEVDEEALNAKGYAEHGKLVRTDSPAFAMEYPETFKRVDLEVGQIFSAASTQGSHYFFVSIFPLEPNSDVMWQLSGFAARQDKALKARGSDVKLIYNKSLDYFKDHPAYQFEFSWKYDSQYPTTTIGYVIAKENQAIMLVGGASSNIDLISDIFKTINLNP
jgi:hypothetical protein